MKSEASVVAMSAVIRKSAGLTAIGLAGLVAALAMPAPSAGAQDATRAARADSSEEKRWQAVAPGRVESLSGEIKITSPVVGLVGEVLVRPNDKVFAGEPLIRLHDNEIQARLAAAEAQIAVRRRARNDQNPSSRASDRRKAEDAVADGEKAVVDTRAALDRVAFERRAGRGSNADLESARTAFGRAQARLKQQKADLRRIETDSSTPLPTQVEGQLNIARAELLVAEAANERMTIRAPIAGSVLQVNVKPGELAGPSSTQPLVLLGDISALRVRAELDERDLAEIRIGHPVLVRAAAFRGREFAGKVSFIAPIVEPGRINARGQRALTDVDVVEVLVDLADAGPLAVGMKVDVYFRQENNQR
jgi:HlyD family secretion protein